MNHYRLRITDKETIKIIRDIGGYENVLENGKEVWGNTEEDARIKLVEQTVFSNYDIKPGQLRPNKECYWELNDIWTDQNKVDIELI